MLRKIFNIIFVFVVPICVGAIAIFATENKIQQYNSILGVNSQVFGCPQNEVFTWIQNSANNAAFNKDNIAAIRLDGVTYMLCSSVINGKFHRLAMSPEDQTYANFSPVVVMDFLYMYNAQHNYQLNAGSFKQILNISRNDPNRKLLEKMIQIAINAYAQNVPDDVKTEIENVRDNGNLGDIFLATNNTNVDIYQQRLDRLKNVIVDFLLRLKRYGDDISCITAKIDDDAIKKTNHLFDDKKKLTYLEVNQQNRQLNSPGAIEILLEKIDKKLTQNAKQNYVPPVITADFVSYLIKYIFKMVSSPWSPDPKDKAMLDALGGGRLEAIADISQVVSAITHTEQLTDWINNNFRNAILVKISGKAPCLKCSHYMQYGENVRDLWNQRTVIGFTTGWRNKQEIDKYRYPIMIFNAKPDFNIKVRKFQAHGVPLSVQVPGTYAEGEFENVVGINKSNCYAIENVDGVPGNEGHHSI